MATKDYSKIGNKKLVKMLETANDEERAAIQAVLDLRAQVATKVATEAAVPEDTTAVPEATVSEDTTTVTEATAEKTKKSTKMDLSPEQIAEKVEDAKKNVGHKCEILPYGEIDWVEGYIVGVVVDKRSNNIMYRIKSEGKYSHKEISAKTLRISDEMAEVPTRTYTGRTAGDKRTDEIAEKMLDEAKVNKGRYVTIEGTKYVINGVVRDKRSNAVMYTLVDSDGKKIYKTVNNQSIVMLDEWNEDIKNRAERVVTKLTNQEKLAAAYEKLEKAKAAVEKLTAEIAELEKVVAAEETEPMQPAETTEETEQPAKVDDLM